MNVKRKISRAFLVHTILVSFVAISLLGYFWIAQEYNRFLKESQDIRTVHMSEYKKLIKNEVDKVIDYIRYKQSQTQIRLKQDIRDRVMEAHGIATNLYFVTKNSIPAAECEKIITEAIRPIRYNRGRGYFFITRMDGITVLRADRPEIEGQDLMAVQDTNGKYVVRDMIQIAKTKGEGFYEYTWTRPDRKGKNFSKIAYIKRFEPFQWFIGTGEYLNDVEEDIQTEVIDRIETISFGSDGYIFAGDWDGLSLSGPAKGKNMIHVKDLNGVPIVQRLIQLAKSGGAYLEYVMPQFGRQQPFPKLSYARSIPEWQWYIGTGISIDDIEAAITKEKNLMEKRIRLNIVKLLGIFLFISLVTFWLARQISDKTRTAFEQFSDFFKSAETGSTEIDTSDLGFHEFEGIAVSANRMIRTIRQTQQEMTGLRDLLQNILDSMPSMLVGVDPMMQVTLWNQEVQRNTGIDPETAKGRVISELLPQVDLQMVQDAVDRKEICKKSKIICNIRKEKGFADITVYPLKAKGLEGAVIRIDDVTDKVRAEEMMIQSEKMLTVGGLAAGMAHELNNPLAGILQNLQVLMNRLSGDLPANHQTAASLHTSMETIKAYLQERSIIEMLGNIKECSIRASQIIKNMLSFSRKSEAVFEPADLRELVDHTIELLKNDYDLKHHYDFKQFQIRREYDPELPAVNCEYSKIQQVVLNLLKNAASAMIGQEAPPLIILRIYKTEKKAFIEIEDNGPGMTKDVCERIFEPFFTTKSTSGTGLGLSISYFIITENHQGTLEVKSAEGQGATFIIGLPL